MDKYVFIHSCSALFSRLFVIGVCVTIKGIFFGKLKVKVAFVCSGDCNVRHTLIFCTGTKNKICFWSCNKHGKRTIMGFNNTSI
ncbi:MAG: hypothetical protein JWQ40_4916 [Segetibacter sp.]|nr:hypothetical protein [Segetibacter sp.]